MRNKIILAGGTGFLGRMLERHFAARAWDVVVLGRFGRGVDKSIRHVCWDGETNGAWVRELEGSRAVVNLAGRSVNCRYTSRNRREILDSRVKSTRALGAAIRCCKSPPAVWLNSSTATIYRHSFDQAMDEWNGAIAATPAVKDEFSIEVARSWEAAFSECVVPGTRKIGMRTAMVLGVENGGVFRVLRRLAKLGLGGRMGDGRQYVSWIHELDFCRAIEWLIETRNMTGMVNLVAPNPIPNAEMMSVYREAVGMRLGLPATDWMLEVGACLLRTETELMIKSRRVIPLRMLQAGFQFRYGHLKEAVAELEGRLGGVRSGGIPRSAAGKEVEA